MPYGKCCTRCEGGFLRKLKEGNQNYLEEMGVESRKASCRRHHEDCVLFLT